MDGEYKVGELAALTGVSTRTLHYYEEIGLLTPALRNASGHRLYGADEALRLQQILSLVKLGFPLKEIRSLFEEPSYSPSRVIEMHLWRLGEQITIGLRLRRKLQALARRLKGVEGVSTSKLLSIIQETTMFEKHYTQEQLEELQKRSRALDADYLREVEQRWREVIADLQKEMDRKTNPLDDSVRRIAQRWKALVLEFTQGDRELTESVAKLYREDGAKIRREHQGSIPSPEMFEFIEPALSSLEGD